MTPQTLTAKADLNLKARLEAVIRRLSPDNSAQRAAFRRERERRGTLGGLLSYDDHMLADMGLLRSEIYTALESPITVDAMSLARQRSHRMLGITDPEPARSID